MSNICEHIQWYEVVFSDMKNENFVQCETIYYSVYSSFDYLLCSANWFFFRFTKCLNFSNILLQKLNPMLLRLLTNYDTMISFRCSKCDVIKEQSLWYSLVSKCASVYVNATS